jgi:hypothetical protein
MLSRRDNAVWEYGYYAGIEDFGGVVIANLIDMGVKRITLNELRDFIYAINQELPDGYIGEHTQELLDQFRESHRVI